MSGFDQNLSEQAKVPYRPIAIRHGLIGALVIIGIGLVFNVTNLIDYTDNSNPGNIASSVLNWVAIIVAMVLAVKTHRNEDLGGFISFGRAFGAAFLTGLVVAVIGFIWSFIFLQLIDPSILEVIAEATRTSMEERGMSASDIDQAWGITKMFISAPAIAFFGFIFTLFGSVVVGLIVAAVMKRQQPGV
jgi:hypothetical protein